MSTSSGGKGQAPATSDRPKKLQRISQACDLCHRRSIRCRPSTENPQQQCQNCFDFGVDCTYKRPSRRRRNPSVSYGQGTPPNIVPYQQPPPDESKSSTEPVSDTVGHPSSNASDYAGAFSSVREGRAEDLVAWRSFALANPDIITELLRVYMDVVYPIFPLFHGPSLWERIGKKEHLCDRGFFASVMGACALASARARDGALFGDYNFAPNGPERQSEMFYMAASDAIFKDLNKAQGLGYLRACGLLAMTAIQYGQIASMHQYLGVFCTLAAMQQFHDEAHWPRNLNLIEKEECRRLYWSMYNLDVLVAVVFNGVMKFQETSANVRYPTEVDDGEITATACVPGPEGNWIRGWNFVTDMYRVLEHTIKGFRRNHQTHGNDRITVTHLFGTERFRDLQVAEGVWTLYSQLPDRFRNFAVPVTGDTLEDLYGFQAANIQATYQLLRMTLFSVDWNQDVYRKCDIAKELLSSLHSICPRFLTMISTPLVYHLGGIGHILASVMEGSLTEDSYERVRALLVSMADLLEGLESGLQPTAGASKGLRSQVDKIDHYMRAQRSSSSYVSAMLDPTSITASYPQGQRAVFPHHHGPLGHSSVGYSVQGAAPQFQLPQEVLGPWPWPFEPQNDPQHPINSVQGFDG
ncbi:hypothetical protein Q7P37_002005 [Cladosporium fusiforme]